MSGVRRRPRRHVTVCCPPVSDDDAVMSRRTLVTLQDDLDGGPADRTVTFTWETTNYQIDLSTIAEAVASSPPDPTLTREDE